MDAHQITHSATLPLQWTCIDTFPEYDILHQLNDSNLECLRQALLLDEFSSIDHNDSTLESRDSSRIERKLDLLLSLFGGLVEQQQTLPRYPVILTASHVQWTGDSIVTIAAGQLLQLQLFLHPCSLSALTLFGEVERAAAATIRLALRKLQGNEQELLQRYIFLNHRRQIAARRKNIPIR